jgi:hypothetical protein
MGPVAADLIGPRGDLAEKAGADVLDGVLELNVIGD